MSHTYANNFVHCIFSTKDRRQLIAPDRRSGLYEYMGAIAKNEGFSLIATGGTSDHVHLLFVLPAPYSLAQAVKKLKGSSSRWMGEDFSWQQGYGAFSVSPSQLQVVKRYIGSQEKHHRRRGFEEEFTFLLRSYGIEYDPRYVFG